jgi:hypothetical protein
MRMPNHIRGVVEGVLGVMVEVAGVTSNGHSSHFQKRLSIDTEEGGGEGGGEIKKKY